MNQGSATKPTGKPFMSGGKSGHGSSAAKCRLLALSGHSVLQRTSAFDPKRAGDHSKLTLITEIKQCVADQVIADADSS